MFDISNFLSLEFCLYNILSSVKAKLFPGYG